MINFNDVIYKILEEKKYKDNGVSKNKYKITFRDPLSGSHYIINEVTQRELNEIKSISLLNVHKKKEKKEIEYIKVDKNEKGLKLNSSSLNKLSKESKLMYISFAENLLRLSMRFIELKEMESSANTTEEIKNRMRINKIKLPLLFDQMDSIRNKMSNFKDVIFNLEKTPFVGIPSTALNEALKSSKKASIKALENSKIEEEINQGLSLGLNG